MPLSRRLPPTPEPRIPSDATPHDEPPPADDAALADAIAAAEPGDVIEIAGGSYGVLQISGRGWSPPLILKAATVGVPPIFSRVYLRDVDGLVLRDLAVKLQARPEHAATTAFVDARRCRNLTILGGWWEGDDDPNTPGYPCGQPYFGDCSNLTLGHVEISHVYRGVSLDVDGLHIDGLHIHDTRRTPILGIVMDAVIENTRLHDVKPWNFGANGDHADFMAFWKEKGGSVIPRGVIIRNNNCWNPDLNAPGEKTLNILGIWITGYENVEFNNNVISGTDHQGIMLTSCLHARVVGNLLVGRGMCLFRAGVRESSMTDNQSAKHDDLDKVNVVTGNTVLQYGSPTRPGYVSPDERSAFRDAQAFETTMQLRDRLEGYLSEDSP